MLQEQLILPVGVTVRDPYGGRYIIEGLLGQGGSGAVYLVRDRRDQQQFALKEIIDPNKEDRLRFAFEGEVLKRLNHKALPRLYRVFEQEKLRRVYMLMDYVAGRDLEALQKEQPEQRFALATVLALCKPVIDALNYLHGQEPPIVHRDIKPSNIIVPTYGDGAVLVDFGIAKEYLADGTTTLIRHGSPGYAAPEHYRGGTSPRTDIYGLGATLYTLLTGVVPPDAIDRATASKGSDPLKPVNLLNPTISLAIAETIARAMSISLDDRFETVEGFWQTLMTLAPDDYAAEFDIKSLSTPQPVILPDQERASRSSGKSTTEPLHRQQPVYQAKSRRKLLPIALAVSGMLVLGIVALAFLVRLHVPPALQPTSPLPKKAHTMTATPTFQPTRVSPIFPPLAASYGGTVVDIFNNEKTPMFLTNIQQNQGSFTGSFQGLGLAGTFQGTVTPSGKIHFTVTIPADGETLSFEGTIKIGGDIVGDFETLNQNGYPTGESGLWNVAARK